MIRVWIVALVLLAGGCAANPPPEVANKEPPKFLNLSPASLGRSMSLSQRATGQYGEKVHKMHLELDVSPERIAIVGLTPLGVTLFTIVHQRGEVEVETLGRSGVDFDPRYTLFDVYLTYWPAEELRPALSRMGLVLEDAMDGALRRIRGPDGETMVEITYSPNHLKTGEIIIRHFDIPYLLRIETVAARETG